MKAMYLLFLTLIISSASFADEQDAPQMAVMIIDMQADWLKTRDGKTENDPENIEKYNKVINEQLKIIEKAKANNQPVALVEYINMGESDPRLKAAIEGYPKAKILMKRRNSLFDRGNFTEQREALDNFINEYNVDSVMIIGSSGSACVAESIKGAYQRGLKTYSYDKAVIDFGSKKYEYPYSELLENELYLCWQVEDDCKSKLFNLLKDEATLNQVMNGFTPSSIDSNQDLEPLFDLNENSTSRNAPPKNSIKSSQYSHDTDPIR